MKFIKQLIFNLSYVLCEEVIEGTLEDLISELPMNED